MALTDFQSVILRCLARNRRENGGSYVAGGLALNYRLGEPRLSRDIDIFHDTVEALLESWRIDRDLLVQNGYSVRPLRELKTFIEAEVSKDGKRTEIQWGTDSAYRFFPLIEDDVVGYTLHPLDLAANKLSALVGRTEPRDWIDVITCIRRLQPLVYLLSAACGKDPGFSPSSMLEYVARRHYNQVEIDAKITPVGMYDAAMLCRLWHEEVDRAREHILEFPRDKAGMCVLDREGNPYKGDPSSLSAAIAAGEVVFHEGRICGAWPQIVR
jgi:hypothetical protein